MFLKTNPKEILSTLKVVQQDFFTSWNIKHEEEEEEEDDNEVVVKEKKNEKIKMKVEKWHVELLSMLREVWQVFLLQLAQA
jgi:hypothetical protein